MKTFTAAGVEHSVVIHPNLEHNLGLYYEQSFEKLMRFLGEHLRVKEFGELGGVQA